jgi:hypothetical protein
MPMNHDTSGSSGKVGLELPPGRLEELEPRLSALLADFAQLEALETPELEPLPAFGIASHDGEDRE